jgi:hypothetical protein
LAESIDDFQGGFNLEENLQKQVSDVYLAESVDFLPSTIFRFSMFSMYDDKLDLFHLGPIAPDEDDWQAKILGIRMERINILATLSQILKPKLTDYDIVLIDWEGRLAGRDSEGALTLNGLYASNYYIILTFGCLPKMVQWYIDAAKALNENISPLGIIISGGHRGPEFEHLQKGKGLPHVYNTCSPSFRPARLKLPQKQTFQQKYGIYSTTYIALAKEIIADLEAEHPLTKPADLQIYDTSDYFALELSADEFW